MKIIVGEFPPNIKKIEAVFGPDKHKTCVYCYGNAIYNPYKIRLEEHIIIHEKVHSEQQEKLTVDYWWMRFMEDSQFRLKQELEACCAQYLFVKERYNAKIAKNLLEDIADNLASSVYNIDITKHQIQTIIRKNCKKYIEKYANRDL